MANIAHGYLRIPMLANSASQVMNWVNCARSIWSHGRKAKNKLKNCGQIADLQPPWLVPSGKLTRQWQTPEINGGFSIAMHARLITREEPNRLYIVILLITRD